MHQFRRGDRVGQSARVRWLGAVAVALLATGPAFATGDLSRAGHIIVLMQENHSFDNYFGALAYAPGSPYHGPATPSSGEQGCDPDDHRCVDGLSCAPTPSGGLTCFDSNLEEDGSVVYAFHDANRCVRPDLDHSWVGTHGEINFVNPADTLLHPLNDGFVRVNDATEQRDTGPETPFEDETIGFYTQDDLPFYYAMAQSFAISDRYFASVPGPTFPNRSYLLAATSFGHLTTSDILPPLPQVSFVDPNLGPIPLFPRENDEHPPTDIQRGQAFVSRVVNAIRNGPYWRDSIVILTYDEHGGFFDHVRPPAAPQGGQPSPDGIAPGQCADRSHLPASLLPGGGALCAHNFLSLTDTSVKDAEALCPALVLDPKGAYPQGCPNFDQLGVRVPFVAISPFSKPGYVSHTIADHASILALIEKRFLPAEDGGRLHLTARDRFASTLEDLFDFDNAPSMHAVVGRAAPPAIDCTP